MDRQRQMPCELPWYCTHKSSSLRLNGVAGLAVDVTVDMALEEWCMVVTLHFVSSEHGSQHRGALAAQLAPQASSCPAAVDGEQSAPTTQQCLCESLVRSLTLYCRFLTKTRDTGINSTLP